MGWDGGLGEGNLGCGKLDLVLKRGGNKMVLIRVVGLLVAKSEG